MGKERVKTDKFKALRSKAEAKLRRRAARVRQRTVDDPEQIIHELQVHQIELEMQNEELRLTQQKLEESRSRYSDLYDFAPIGYFTFDKNGLVLEANLTGCRMLGIERSSLVKKKFALFIDDGDRDEFYKHRRAVQTPGLSQTCELTLLRNNEDKFDALLESVGAPDAKGNLTLCRTVVTEITERKKAERELIESKQRLRLVIESGSTGTWDWDIQTKQVAWNDRLYEMLGLSPDVKGVTAETFFHHVHPLDLPRVQKTITGVLKSGTDYKDTFRIVWDNGQIRWLSSRGRLFRDERGKPVRMMGVNYDITEQQQAQEKLRASEQKFHSLFTSMSEAFVLFELVRDNAGKVVDCRVLDANPAVEKMTGIAPKDAIGQTIRQLFPDMDEFWFETYGNVEATSEPVSFERRFEPLDRYYHTCVYRPAPGLIAIIFTDITDRVLAAQTLRRVTQLSEGLNRINEAIHSTLKPTEVIERLIAEGAAALGSESAAVSLRQPGGWTVAHAHDMPSDLVGMRMSDDQERHAVLAIEQDKPVAVSDASSDHRVNQEHLREHNIRAVLVAPLVLRGKPIGVMLFNYHSGPHAFTDAEVDFARQLAGTAAIALDNARLFEQHEQAERTLAQDARRDELLSKTSARLLESEDPQSTVEDLCRQVCDLLNCQVFFNFLVDEAAGRLHLNVCTGIPAQERQKIEWLDYGVAICGCVARDRQRIIAEDIQNTADPRTDMVKSFGVQAYCCHPLIVQGRLIGTLSFGTRTGPHFSPDDVEVMKSVTDLVGIAMHRIEAERALRDSNKELSRFNRVMVGREVRMIELKKQVNELCVQARLQPRYWLDAENDKGLGKDQTAR